jgi:hypothetical protein
MPKGRNCIDVGTATASPPDPWSASLNFRLMKVVTVLRRALIVVLMAVVVMTACTSERTVSGRAQKLHNLEDVSQLRAAFNHDVGHPRLILLFSPT